MSRRGAAALAAYVLHRYDWSESSLIVDLFTRELGRVVVAAKGAKRPTSQLRAVLRPFQRIQATLGRTARGWAPRSTTCAVLNGPVACRSPAAMRSSAAST